MSSMRESSPLATAAHVALCAVAASIPIDEIMVAATGIDRAAFAPTLHTGVAATVLWLPVLAVRPWARRHLAPVLLLAGSMAVGVLALLVLAATGDARVEARYLPYQPLKFTILGVLFATAAVDPRWRRRLQLSYMAGWAGFVAYAGWEIATGRAASTRIAEDLARVSVAGLNENQQAILVATGMVIALAELLQPQRLLHAVPWVAALLGGGAVFVFGGSRGASVGLAAGLLFALAGWARGGGRARLAPVLALASALAVGIVCSSGPVGEAAGMLLGRFESSVHGRDFGDRDRRAAETLRLALDNPWSGIGFGRVRDQLGDDPHNGYLKIVAEGGALAALLLAAWLLATAAALRRTGRLGPDLGVAGALVLLLVTALVGQSLMRPPFWFFLAATSAAAFGSRGVRAPVNP